MPYSNEENQETIISDSECSDLQTIITASNPDNNDLGLQSLCLNGNFAVKQLSDTSSLSSPIIWLINEPTENRFNDIDAVNVKRDEKMDTEFNNICFKIDNDDRLTADSCESLSNMKNVEASVSCFDHISQAHPLSSSLYYMENEEKIDNDLSRVLENIRTDLLINEREQDSATPDLYLQNDSLCVTTNYEFCGEREMDDPNNLQNCNFVFTNDTALHKKDESSFNEVNGCFHNMNIPKKREHYSVSPKMPCSSTHSNNSLIEICDFAKSTEKAFHPKKRKEGGFDSQLKEVADVNDKFSLIHSMSEENDDDLNASQSLLSATNLLPQNSLLFSTVSSENYNKSMKSEGELTEIRKNVLNDKSTEYVVTHCSEMTIRSDENPDEESGLVRAQYKQEEKFEKRRKGGGKHFDKKKCSVKVNCLDSVLNSTELNPKIQTRSKTKKLGKLRRTIYKENLRLPTSALEKHTKEPQLLNKCKYNCELDMPETSVSSSKNKSTKQYLDILNKIKCKLSKIQKELAKNKTDSLKLINFHIVLVKVLSILKRIEDKQESLTSNLVLEKKKNKTFSYNILTKVKYKLKELFLFHANLSQQVSQQEEIMKERKKEFKYSQNNISDGKSNLSELILEESEYWNRESPSFLPLPGGKQAPRLSISEHESVLPEVDIHSCAEVVRSDKSFVCGFTGHKNGVSEIEMQQLFSKQNNQKSGFLTTKPADPSRIKGIVLKNRITESITETRNLSLPTISTIPLITNSPDPSLVSTNICIEQNSTIKNCQEQNKVPKKNISDVEHDYYTKELGFEEKSPEFQRYNKIFEPGVIEPNAYKQKGHLASLEPKIVYNYNNFSNVPVTFASDKNIEDCASITIINQQGEDACQNSFKFQGCFSPLLSPSTSKIANLTTVAPSSSLFSSTVQTSVYSTAPTPIDSEVSSATIFTKQESNEPTVDYLLTDLCSMKIRLIEDDELMDCQKGLPDNFWDEAQWEMVQIPESLWETVDLW